MVCVSGVGGRERPPTLRLASFILVVASTWAILAVAFCGKCLLFCLRLRNTARAPMSASVVGGRECPPTLGLAGFIRVVAPTWAIPAGPVWKVLSVLDREYNACAACG